MKKSNKRKGSANKTLRSTGNARPVGVRARSRGNRGRLRSTGGSRPVR